MKGPVVITGGGTGGHIFPMKAIAEQLQRRGIGAGDIRFVGSRRGQESRLLADSPVELTLLAGRGIQRSIAPRALIDNVRALWGLGEAVAVALIRLAKWRPSVVVSVGGYASFAVSLAAVLYRRPLVLVDLDATPGAVHRIFERFAHTRCTAFASREPRTVFTGVPLRDAIVSLDRSDDARQRLRSKQDPPIESSRRVLVVMTGSLGASSVNRAVSELARRWSDRADLTLIHVTGRRDFDEILARVPGRGVLDYRVVEFADMSELWGLCDLAICRAGATTVAELTALGIASVLVPLPGAPGDHQSKNAAALETAGAAKVVADRDCTAETLEKVVDEVLSSALVSMSGAAASLGRRGASAEIAKVVAEVGGWA
ncbi:MAG: UDP-N-acetylglucosamine--N-acetylmuramyl-(pentapeptide) pyrophosphoryl-undecaprenol N-acetylglucosamine transferase [Acidimicrobiales bacterium]